MAKPSSRLNPAAEPFEFQVPFTPLQQNQNASTINSDKTLRSFYSLFDIPPLLSNEGPSTPWFSSANRTQLPSLGDLIHQHDNPTTISNLPFVHAKYPNVDGVPFKQIKWLGRGNSGVVEEMEYIGEEIPWSGRKNGLPKRLARKSIAFPTFGYRSNLEDINEIQVMKVLSHQHIVRLVGTYGVTALGRMSWAVLLAPVGDTNLETFLIETVEKEFFKSQLSLLRKWSVGLFIQYYCIPSRPRYSTQRYQVNQFHNQE
jgi:hypothetical protein